MLADICLVAVFALFVYRGHKNGFIKSVYSILSLIATVVLVSLFKDTFVKEIANSPVGVAIGEMFVGSSADPKLVSLCSEGAVYVASLVIFYALIRLVLRFTLTIVNSIASLPVIDSLNKILGLILGGIIGIIWLVVIIGVLINIPKTAPWFNNSVIVEYFRIIFM